MRYVTRSVQRGLYEQVATSLHQVGIKLLLSRNILRKIGPRHKVQLLKFLHENTWVRHSTRCFIKITLHLTSIEIWTMLSSFEFGALKEQILIMFTS